VRFSLPLRPIVMFQRYRRAMTLGVRGMVLENDRRVLLVRHTYTPGWHLPGGGVEPGETAAEALARELREEAGIALEGEADLFGLYLQRVFAARDHVALYVCRGWRQIEGHRRASLEIAECAFFPVDSLPAGTTEPTRRRIAEVVEGSPRAADW
jgi:8-oxo-dGTP pyrophosphatase MutT (NUDIX family)